MQYTEGATYLLTETTPVKVISTECSSEYKDIFDLITVAYTMLLVFLYKHRKLPFCLVKLTVIISKIQKRLVFLYSRIYSSL